jgi:hypothetical protein
MNNSPAFTNLSFVMVDLTPKMHYGLTTGSLLSTATDNLYYFSSVIDKSCNTCRTGIQVSIAPAFKIQGHTLLDIPKSASRRVGVKLITKLGNCEEKVEFIEGAFKRAAAIASSGSRGKEPRAHIRL